MLAEGMEFCCPFGCWGKSVGCTPPQMGGGRMWPRAELGVRAGALGRSLLKANAHHCPRTEEPAGIQRWRLWAPAEVFYGW